MNDYYAYTPGDNDEVTEPEQWLAAAIYENIRRNVGFSTLKKLQQLIMENPFTVTVEKEDVHPLDDDD